MQKTKEQNNFFSAFLWNFFLCQNRWHGDVPPHLAQPCYVALGWALDSGLLCYFKLWVINIVIPIRDLNLGLKHLSLLEFETWWIRPLGHLALWSWEHFLVSRVTVNQFKQISTLHNIFSVVSIFQCSLMEMWTWTSVKGQL